MKPERLSLPNSAPAVVDIEKLRDYCLSESHPRGRHKARVFATRLGLSSREAETLRDMILSGVLNAHALEGEQDIFGQRYTVDIQVVDLSGGAITIRTAWIVRTNEDFPRLVTCYIL